MPIIITSDQQKIDLRELESREEFQNLKIEELQGFYHYYSDDNNKVWEAGKLIQMYGQLGLETYLFCGYNAENAKHLIEHQYLGEFDSLSGVAQAYLSRFYPETPRILIDQLDFLELGVELIERKHIVVIESDDNNKLFVFWLH